MTIDEALYGKDIPHTIKETLTLVDIPYISPKGEILTGQLLIHRAVENEVSEIFNELLQMRFPVTKMIPIVFYHWEDGESMKDDNTSAFNYRTIAGTDRLSNHSYGLAIDINPGLNPYVKDGLILPEGAIYDVTKAGTITPEIAEVFLRRGWVWGGEWETLKDWQHFEKTL